MAVGAQAPWWRARPAEPLRKPGLSLVVSLSLGLPLCLALWAVTGDVSDGTRWAFVHVGGAVFGVACFLTAQLHSRPVARGCVQGAGVAAMVAGYMLGRPLVGHLAMLIVLVWALAVCFALLGAFAFGRRSARSS